MEQVSTEETLEALCTYVDLGWSVCPLHVKEQNNPSKERSVIEEWLGRWPNCDVGIELGVDSGVIALEIDLKGPGARRLASLEKTHERLPVTTTYRYGATTEVRLFRHPGYRLGARTVIGDGLWLHGDLACIEVPPFLHIDPARSKLFWDDPPDWTEVAEAPEWLLIRTGVARPSPRLTLARTPESGYLPFRNGYGLGQVATRWIASPWIARETVSVFTGRPKVAGKTSFLVHLAAHLLEGRLFLGERLVAQPVLYLTEERRSSFARHLREAGLERDEQLRDLHVLFAQDVRQRGWSDLITSATAAARRLGASLMVVDSIHAFCDTEDPALALADAAAEGLALAVVDGQACHEGDLRTVVPELGHLGTVADSIFRFRAPLEQGYVSSMRVVDGLSRYDRVRDHVLLTRSAGTYHAGVHETPLFADPGPLRVLGAASA